MSAYSGRLGGQLVPLPKLCRASPASCVCVCRAGRWGGGGGVKGSWNVRCVRLICYPLILLHIVFSVLVLLREFLFGRVEGGRQIPPINRINGAFVEENQFCTGKRNKGISCFSYKG